jgi:hypothetical protein
VINNRPIDIAIKIGIRGFTTLAMVVFPTPQPMKRQVPTGGVQRPIQRFAIMKIPKCTGSIPNFMTTGNSIGVKIKTAGVISINVPTTSRRRLMMSRITN